MNGLSIVRILCRLVPSGRGMHAALVGEIETAMDDNQSLGSISTAPTAPTCASDITESSAGSVHGEEICVPSISMGRFVGSTSGSPC